jgi:hypothetical protein
VKITRPLITGRGMYNRRVLCDIDLLLCCNSVKEIEEVMRNRRQGR